jgi:hypothetical protein
MDYLMEAKSACSLTLIDHSCYILAHIIETELKNVDKEDVIK